MTGKDFGLRVARSFANYDQCYCPFHMDSHPSAAFYHDSLTLYCFTCMRSFPLRDVVSQVGGGEWTQEELDDFVGSVETRVEMKSFFDDDDISHDMRGFKIFSDDPAAMDYLRVRDVDPEVADEYKLKANSDGIVFQHGTPKVPGYVVRNYIPPAKTLRYIKHGNLDTFWPSQKLLTPARYIFVTEGPFKAMRLKKTLNDMKISDADSLCSFGLKFDRAYVKKLGGSNKTILIVGDADGAGLSWASKFKGIPGFHPFIAHLPFDEAPADRSQVMVTSMLNHVEASSNIAMF